MEFTDRGFPFVSAKVYKTVAGVRYLQTPGMAMLAKPEVDITGLTDFFEGFPKELFFDEYLNDPVELTPAERLAKTAGQWCYLSFGPERTMNVEADKYFLNIKKSKHGSIMEHANFTMALWGVSRSFTHEIVRHRAGCGFSQVSQRYVGGSTLRFVERPEYVADPNLHRLFESSIENAVYSYEMLTNYLLVKQSEGEAILSAERKTDLKKKVRQCARSRLPNETEAPIIVTGNVRAWRNILEARVSPQAEVEIRRVIYHLFGCLQPFLPNILSDFETVELVDGTLALTTPFSKV